MSKVIILKLIKCNFITKKSNLTFHLRYHTSESKTFTTRDDKPESTYIAPVQAPEIIRTGRELEGYVTIHWDDSLRRSWKSALVTELALYWEYLSAEEWLTKINDNK